MQAIIENAGLCREVLESASLALCCMIAALIDVDGPRPDVRSKLVSKTVEKIALYQVRPQV